MKHPITFLSFAVASIIAMQANADPTPREQAKLNKKLNGQYIAVQQFSCVGAPNGFGPRPQIAVVGQNTLWSGTTTSVNTYNGDGTVTIVGKSMTVRGNQNVAPTATTYPVGTSTYSCQGVYQVNADKTVTQDMTCSGQLVDSTIPGLPWTQSNSHAAGYVLGKTILMTNVDPDVETTTTVYGPNPAICARTFTIKKLQEDADNDD